MNVSIFNAVVAMLQADQSLSKTDRDKILAVCQNPRHFEEPPARSLPLILTLRRPQSALQAIEFPKEMGDLVPNDSPWARQTRNGLIPPFDS